MAFYPLNTPFINYYFYKAPFINDAYSLTGFSILSGGAGFAVNDVLILGGGTYTNPAVIQVTSVLSGVITGFNINNNGKYSITPTVLTMLSTNGSGTGATFGTVVSTPNLYPIGPNVPLAGGFIYFYEDENRTVQADTYSDVSDSQNPVINPNPIQLGSSGDFPPIYMDDRLYYIVITDNTGDESNPVEVLEHYDPTDILSQRSAFNDNFIVNPQFNYPIDFYKTTDEVGEITQPVTNVAWAWEFLEDENTLSENYVTIENICGQQIEGSPINQLVISCEVASENEMTKDLRSYLGSVDFYSEGTLTFLCQMINLRTQTTNVSLILELFYGTGGSPAEEILIETFSVGVTRKKVFSSFTMPSLSGKTIAEGNYSAIRIQPSLQSVCSIGLTNVMVVPGNQPSTIFSDEAYGFSKGEIIGAVTDINNAGLNESYCYYQYVDGDILPYARTGEILLMTSTQKTPIAEKCDGSVRKISDYSPDLIPYKRLYDVIGDTYGSGAGLISSSNGSLITVSSRQGAREKTAYTAGTTTFIVTRTVMGLAAGIKLTNNHDMTLSGEFADNFAPLQTAPSFGPPGIDPQFQGSGNGLLTYWGTSYDSIHSNNITFVTTDPGSVGTQATFDLTFTSTNPADYQTRDVFVPPDGVKQCSSFIEYASVANNNRQIGQYDMNQQIIWTLDGKSNAPTGDRHTSTYMGHAGISTVVPFLSAKSIEENIKIFVSTVSNPFTWTISVTVFPVAGSYILYSSETVDYYGWITIDGVGVDPAIVGRTGVEMPLFTGQSLDRVAAIIAEKINDASFTLPDPSQLPALVTSSLVSWFICL